jgi:UDP-glucose 4-epimerase
MQVLVTGGVGFVGTNLIKRLLHDEHEVISIDNYSTGFTHNEQDGCQYIHGGLQDMEFWGRGLEKQDMIPDVIFHMAALPRIKPSFENPKEVMEVNVNGTLNVLEYAREHKIPVIYAGSSSFWGGVYKNPYTFSKWQGEELCKMYERIYGLSVTICRFYNVYGEHMPVEGSYRTVLSIFKEQCRKGEPLTITGDGKQRRDFTHVDDIVEAMMRCVLMNKWGSMTPYELGRGRNHSINEVADMFGKWSSEGKIYIDEIPGESRDTLCRSELARKKLKWNPKNNLKDWIREQI